ncbi:hypothetical protein LCM10_08095 [Rossellomorea aquimaris]|uniref:aKG-HExxH-type peptide beta-hydroxylase n=1 Tax=Rossellomorea aquimaris TaxID=189382 RepID=UPI001CD1B48D|nr:HEXXH motif-containing putative peptide modification protein [Rossellomorea aquimaris]MCA1054943.1 hypothetical protein [Rossellomorea aquimaris]
MITLAGYEDILTTIYKLGYPYLNSDAPTYKDIKSALQSHNGLMNEKIIYRNELEPDILESDDDSLVNRKRAGLLLEEFDLIEENGRHQTNQFDGKNRVQMALQYIKSNDSQLADIFQMVVDTILLTRDVTIPGSASAANALGMIWIQPAESWTDMDVVESLVHEMVHILTYLDEQCYGHYTNSVKINDEITWVPSAIRSEKRPVHMVVHSIIVAVEILSLRKRLGIKDEDIKIHGSTSILLNRTKLSITALRENPESWNLLTTRMQELITTSEEYLLTLLYSEYQNVYLSK